MGPNGAKHGGRWLTPPGFVGSGRGRDGGGQQCNEEKEEINQEEVREDSGEEKKETRGMRWADRKDDEGKEKEEQEQENLLIIWRIQRCQLTRFSLVGAESFHVTRDCKAVVDPVASPR